MKKWLSVLLVALLAASLCACGSGKNKDLPIDTVVNKNGTACTVDITTRGEVQADAEPVGSFQFEFDGNRYTFPIRVSKFVGTKWKMTSVFDDPDHPSNVGKQPVDGNSVGLASVLLRSDSGAKLDLSQVMNDNSASMSLSNCWVREIVIRIDEETHTPDCEFVLPGGITARSTAADILSVYGNPNGSSRFSPGSSTEDTFEYSYQVDTGISYTFTFYPDGSLAEVRVLATPSTIEKGT